MPVSPQPMLMADSTTMIAGGVAALLVAYIVFFFWQRSKKSAKSIDRDFEPVAQPKPAPRPKPAAPKPAAPKPAAPKPAPKPAASAKPSGALVVIDGPLEGKRFALDSANVVAGREEEKCDLVFPTEGGDNSISRVHCTFSFSGGAWKVTCMTDGVFAVNGNPVAKGNSSPLSGGDFLTLGRTTMEFQAG